MTGFILAFITGIAGWYLGLVAYRGTGEPMFAVVSIGLLIIAIISIVVVLTRKLH